MLLSLLGVRPTTVAFGTYCQDPSYNQEVVREESLKFRQFRLGPRAVKRRKGYLMLCYWCVLGYPAGALDRCNRQNPSMLQRCPWGFLLNPNPARLLRSHP